MDKKRKSLLVFGSLCVILFGQVSLVQAETDISAVSGFSYETILPENQVGDVGYFDLKMTPGQRQTVEIKLKSFSKTPLEVSVALTGARTNPNGVIEYGPNTFKKDSSMKFDFTDVVKGPETVELPPEAEVVVPLEITMPETTFDGEILGGIQLREKKSGEKKKKEKKSGSTVVNEYAYNIGMILSETEKELPPKMSFIKAVADQPNYRNAVVVDLANTQAAILEGLTVEAQVMKENSEKVLYESKKANMRMAPNTILDFWISMDGQPMVPGRYRVHILATTAKDKWEWTEPFEITKAQAEQFNRKDVDLEQSMGVNLKLVWMIVGGVLLLGVLVGLMVYLIRKKNKTSKENREEKRKDRKPSMKKR